MVRSFVPAIARRPVWIALGLLAALCLATPARAQAPAQAQTVSNARQFPNDAGIVLNFIKPALKDGALAIDWNDEVFAASCVTHDGSIRHEPTRKLVETA